MTTDSANPLDIESGSDTDLAAVRTEVEVRSQLAEAQALVAESRLRCTRMLEAARKEADTMIADARAAARRIIAEAEAHETGIDLRPRASASFSELWALADDEPADGFFHDIPERCVYDVFSA